MRSSRKHFAIDRLGLGTGLEFSDGLSDQTGMVFWKTLNYAPNENIP
jgi:hypothetical protein